MTGRKVPMLAIVVIAIMPFVALPAKAECLPTPNGIVAWFAGNGHPYDLAGSNHALAHNGLLYVPGQVDEAFGFDGAGSYLDVLDSAELDNLVAAEFTITAWMKFPAGSGATQFILDKREQVGSGGARGIALYLQGGRIGLQFNDDSGSSDFVAGGADLRDGEFHFVAVVVDRSSTTGGSIRVDGQEVAAFDPTVRPGSLATAGGLRIGGYMFDAVAQYWMMGVLDELDLYARALGEGELESLREATPEGKCRPGIYFGEDINQSDPPSPEDTPARLDSLPECRAAQAAFLAALGPAHQTNGFEELPPGGSVTELEFGVTTAAVLGDLTTLEIATGTYNGAYPTLGQRCGFQFNNGGSFTLEFDAPQIAIGFIGTDIGDGGARLLLTLRRVDGTTANLVVPNSTSGSAPWPNISGSALFFGVIDAARPFDAITFTNPRVQLDGFGFDEITISGAASAVPPEGIVRHHLRQNQPNPFNPRTVIGFELPAPGHVRLAVYDIAGRLVRTIADGPFLQGLHELTWEGKDSRGREAGSGTYVARLDFAGRTEAIQMVLVR